MTTEMISTKQRASMHANTSCYVYDGIQEMAMMLKQNRLNVYIK